jgi:iron(III) transport system substrate-binding protein
MRFKDVPRRSLVFRVAAGWLFLAFGTGSVPLGLEAASVRPATVADLALYQGPDRQRILLEGAKKEGTVTFYNSYTWFEVLAREFEKKYPFIKVSVWRSEGAAVIKRVTEEYRAGQPLVDVIECSQAEIMLFHKLGLFQEHFSPEIRFYPDEVRLTGKTGVYYWADRETYISLGFNTKLVDPAEAPKNLKDLLDPKWKGKISLAGGATGVRWFGAVLNAAGRDFMEKLSRQDVKLHGLSGAALAALIVSGEVPLSPTIFDSNIFVAQRKGAPVEWRPIEPVVVNVGNSGLPPKAPHPHAALLLLDYIHSKEGQQVMVKGGLSSPRPDVVSSERKFNKTYLEAKYPLEQYDNNYREWEQLIRQLFIRAH